MSRSRPLVVGGLTALLALVLAGSAVAAPAVDEYGANLPTSKGQKSQGTTIPKAQPENLPPDVAKKLDSSPNSKQLEAVATADALGAPQTPAGNSGSGQGGISDDSSDEGFLKAATGSLGSPWVLVLILGLALGGFAAWWARRDRTA
jgi:hypothetical protein